MRHARPEALDRLEPLLARLRTLGGLVEKSRGVFYRRAAAYLHFHEDPAGLFADVRLDGRTFHRVRVETPEEQQALLTLLVEAISRPPP